MNDRFSFVDKTSIELCKDQSVPKVVCLIL